MTEVQTCPLPISLAPRFDAPKGDIVIVVGPGEAEAASEAAMKKTHE